MSVSEATVTIGVELEFIVRGLPKNIPEAGQFKLVADALVPLAERLGAQVLDMVSFRENYQLPHSVVTAGFQVKRDMSIKVETEGLAQRAVEIATPILRNEQWKSAIPEMTQILSSTFNLGFNPSTGLHVHIGIGREYTLHDLKRISKAIVIFEKTLDTYHPEHRRANKGNHPYNAYIRSNRENFMLHDLSDTHMIEAIDGAPDIPNLLSIINSPTGDTAAKYSRQYRYNLTSVKRFQTVEFRQAAATDDGDQIVQWIGMIIKFITTAISTPDCEFDIWASHGIHDPNVYRWFGVPVPEN